MTPYLTLVLAGFTIFVVALGVVTTRGWIAAVKAKSAQRPSDARTY